MADRHRTISTELASAGVFGMGCLGLCALVIELGPDGVALGFASYVAGLIIATELADRRGPRPRR